MLTKKKHILATEKSPEIILDPKGFITIRGRCMEENVTSCSEPILNWINEYRHDPAEITCIDIHLEYVNEFHSGILLSLLKEFLFIITQNKKLIINWYYEDGDEDIFEQGEYLSSVLGFPFNFIGTAEHAIVR